MKEIIFYGRGGQGAVIASKILAIAAFKEGKKVQSFPFFGVERRGAPVSAYTRISDFEIRKRIPIDEPDYIIVLDPSLIGALDIAKGLKKRGSIVINTKNPASAYKFQKNSKIFTFDATSIAIKHNLGTKSAPIVNTTILGAFSKFTGEISIKSLLEAINENIAIATTDNMAAAKEAYEKA